MAYCVYMSVANMLKQAVKIKTYKVGKRGSRGYVLSLPKVWLEDVQMHEGDLVEVFRDTDNRLIIVRSENQDQGATV
jgi:bifunctional DNA-binding transcriptional regulator/antitoxin component of YhaV-PrlF toxin-antitoxin module